MRPDTILILGGTGLLGQALTRAAQARGISVRTAARHGADLDLDVTDTSMLDDILAREDPSTVFNCVALVDIAECERRPDRAYCVNARPVANLARWSQHTGRPIVQISTDHFFKTLDPDKHAENAPIELRNEYARTKYAAEAFALAAPAALVLRTSIVGIRGWPQPTFAEWALAVIEEDRDATLYVDAFTSSIDTMAFAAAALDLLSLGTTGLLNLAAREVYSKEAFVRTLAARIGKPLTRARSGGLPKDQLRASGLGLDVRRAEALIDRRLPGLDQVVDAILEQRRERAYLAL